MINYNRERGYFKSETSDFTKVSCNYPWHWFSGSLLKKKFKHMFPCIHHFFFYKFWRSSNFLIIPDWYISWERMSTICVQEVENRHFLSERVECGRLWLIVHQIIFLLVLSTELIYISQPSLQSLQWLLSSWCGILTKCPRSIGGL